MENFRKKVIKRIRILTVFILIFCVYIVLDVFFIRNNIDSENFINSFQFGLMFGLEMLAIINLIKLNKVVKSDKKLKLLYNKENDERLKLIRSKAGMPLLLINSVIMIISGIILGYFNTIIFLTLIITAGIQMLIGLFIKFYCLRKF
ncbi:MAG: hypothetical protein PWP28_482 [Oceanotoga sp.]|jgi:hypothetical protein|uniref:Uncharacterized protein n=1 Tax=Oceanotoga teriensis TaxID=515440 RepID=A0AA45HJR8_9BACT|nr:MULTISPECIES: hypothetical protein [Oceanotoga]MDN5341607.1 hypothetical protein [Oceanotoga sp.]PWJ96539.1 hypothetical protein C7380_101111 [Oceanotoga teriensis]